MPPAVFCAPLYKAQQLKEYFISPVHRHYWNSSPRRAGLKARLIMTPTRRNDRTSPVPSLTSARSRVRHGRVIDMSRCLCSFVQTLTAQSVSEDSGGVPLQHKSELSFEVKESKKIHDSEKTCLTNASTKPPS